MSDISVFLPWTAAHELLNPVRRQCDPTHRWGYEIYCRVNYIEVVAIDYGPVSDKSISLSVSKA